MRFLHRLQGTHRGASRRPLLLNSNKHDYDPHGSIGPAPPLNAVAIR